MIKYTNISGKEYYDLSVEERKEKPYCIKYTNGDKEWFINGRRHKEDGPAVEYIDGDKYWFINGTSYSFEEWLKSLQIPDEEKIFLRLKYP